MPRSRGRNDNNIREDNPRENSRLCYARWHSSHQRRKRRPGIVDDYRSTFAKVKAMRIDVLLGPHPEVYGMQDKRAQQIKSETPNPFVKPGELATYATGLADVFDNALAKQTAALQAAK